MVLLANRARSGGGVREVMGLLAPSSGRLEYATRQALICALTTFVVQLYQTPEPALTVYVVFFLNRSDRASSLMMNIITLLLMSTVIGIVILTTLFVIDQPMWRVASIALLSFGILFLASASKLRPVGPTVAIIVGSALDRLGTSPGGEIAIRALLYAWLFVAVPAAVALVVNFMIAPAPRRLVERALARRLRVSAAVLRRPNPATRAALDACIKDIPGDLPAWLRLAGVERSSSEKDLAALQHGMEASVAILLLVQLTAGSPAATLPAAFRERIVRILEEMAKILRAGGYPVEIELPTDHHDAHLSEVPNALMNDLREALVHFAIPDLNPSMPPAPEPAARFFHPDAFSNPEHIQYALKTTGAALFCYVLYVMLDWPGIHTCFITCYIVALSTSAEVVEKLTLRIVGCLVGSAFGLAAIVYFVPALTSIGSLMTIVFLGALGAAWVAGGSPRIAYAGFQIAFAFFLCVIQGPAPALDMVTARDRVIGILIGNIVAYLVFVYVWPVSVARRIDPGIGSLLRGLSKLAQTASLSGRRSLTAQNLSAISTLERDLHLLAYEPRSIRPSDVWREHRYQALQDMAALNAPLLLAADCDIDVSSSFVQRLDRLADGFVPDASASAPARSENAPLFGEVPSDAPNSLWRLVNRRLTTLERAAAPSAQGQVSFGHA